MGQQPDGAETDTQIRGATPIPAHELTIVPQASGLSPAFQSVFICEQIFYLPAVIVLVGVLVGLKTVALPVVYERIIS